MNKSAVETTEECKKCRGTGYQLQRSHAAMPPDKCKECGGKGFKGVLTIKGHMNYGLVKNGTDEVYLTQFEVSNGATIKIKILRDKVDNAERPMMYLFRKINSALIKHGVEQKEITDYNKRLADRCFNAA